MKIKIAIKEPNKPLKIVMIEEKYRTNAVKSFLDGYAQFVGLDGGKGLLSVGVDEDGLMKQLPTNFYLSTNLFASEKIVGVAVFTRHKYVNVFEQEVYDYELEDLTDEDIESIEKMLGEEYQSKVEEIYKKKGGNTFRFIEI